MRAKDIMTAPAVCVRPSTPLGEVAVILAENGFTAVPVVVENGRLVGLVSETDLIRERFGLRPQTQGSAGEGQPRSTAAEVMTAPVEYVGPETSLSALAKRMVTGRRRSVPVVEADQVVGIVTRRDVVDTIARSDEAILEGVQDRLTRHGFRNSLRVRVQSGVVHLWGEIDPRQEHEAVIVAESVPGVMRVTVSGPGRPGANGGVGIA